MPSIFNLEGRQNLRCHDGPWIVLLLLRLLSLTTVSGGLACYILSPRYVRTELGYPDLVDNYFVLGVLVCGILWSLLAVYQNIINAQTIMLRFCIWANLVLTACLTYPVYLLTSSMLLIAQYENAQAIAPLCASSPKYEYQSIPAYKLLEYSSEEDCISGMRKAIIFIRIYMAVSYVYMGLCLTLLVLAIIVGCRRRCREERAAREQAHYFEEERITAWEKENESRGYVRQMELAHMGYSRDEEKRRFRQELMEMRSEREHP